MVVVDEKTECSTVLHDGETETLLTVHVVVRSSTVRLRITIGVHYAPTASSMHSTVQYCTTGVVHISLSFTTDL